MLLPQKIWLDEMLLQELLLYKLCKEEDEDLIKIIFIYVYIIYRLINYIKNSQE